MSVEPWVKLGTVAKLDRYSSHSIMDSHGLFQVDKNRSAHMRYGFCSLNKRAALIPDPDDPKTKAWRTDWPRHSWGGDLGTTIESQAHPLGARGCIREGLNWFITGRNVMAMSEDRRFHLAEWSRIIKGLAPFFGPHKATFWLGVFASLGVVACRVGLPWVFKLLLNPVIRGGTASDTSNLLLLAGFSVFLILLAWGYFDQLLRWHFAKFAIGVTRLAQAHAAESLEVGSNYARVKGDLAFRLLGDASRLQSGMKSFLVLVLVNSLLLFVSCGVLLMVNVSVGLVMTGASAGIFLVTLFSASDLFRVARRKRKREGRFAELLNQRSTGEAIDEFDFQPHDSDESDAISTRIQGRATWIAYTLFGLATVTSLILAVGDLHRGALNHGDMVVLMLYLFNIRAPIIRLTRQGCKTGQVLAGAERLQELFATGPVAWTGQMQHQLLIQDLRIRSRQDSEKKYALKVQNLSIQAGDSIALLGRSGSGKSLLLKTLAGQLNPRRALVLFDHTSYDQTELAALTGNTYYLPQNPTWSKRPLSQVLGVEELPSAPEAIPSALSACGFSKLLRSFPEGLATELSSEELSFGQRRSVALAQAVLATESIVLLDSPELGLKATSIPKYLKAVLKVHASRTLLVALSTDEHIDVFRRVVALREGKVRFDGTVAEWNERKRLKAAQAAEVTVEAPPA